MSSDTPGIAGTVEPGWELVARAFAANFDERDELGASVCVRHRGEVVVDLWGGWADRAHTRTWEADTLVNVYSVTKAVVATLALRLVGDGRLDLTMPVAEVWPEFASGDKHDVTVAEALSHRARVPGLTVPLTDDDLASWSTMTEALAATPAWWGRDDPDRPVHCYHTNSYGHLIGELVRRAGGDTPGRALRELGLGDVWIGVPDAEHHRCAEVDWDSPMEGPSASEVAALLADPATPVDVLLPMASYYNPPGYSSAGIVNTPEWRRTEVPSTNGHASARGIAGFYDALLEPGRLLSDDLLSEATRAHSSGPCPILGEDVTFGLGFVPTSERRPLGPNTRSFGHFGTGGALGYADPDDQLAFGYVMNHVRPRWQSSRNRALIEAVTSVLHPSGTG